MIRKKRLYKTVRIAAICSLCNYILFLSLPNDESLSLSTMIVYMTGGQMQPFLSRLLNFSLMLTPTFLFAMMLGTEYYQHFCIANVYIFSREPRRTTWYMIEAFWIFVQTLVYECVVMAVTLLLAAVFQNLDFSTTGIQLMLMHIGLYTLWLFGLILLINTLSILLGSEYGFLISFALQILQLALLYWPNDEGFNPISSYLPIAHLVTFWHTSTNDTLTEVLSQKIQIFSFAESFLLMSGHTLVIFLISIYVINRFNILSPKETGGAA